MPRKRKAENADLPLNVYGLCRWEQKSHKMCVGGCEERCWRLEHYERSEAYRRLVEYERKHHKTEGEMMDEDDA